VRRVSFQHLRSSPGAEAAGHDLDVADLAAEAGIDPGHHDHQAVVGEVASVAQHALGDVDTTGLIQIAQPGLHPPAGRASSGVTSSTSPLSRMWMRSPVMSSAAASCAWARWWRGSPWIGAKNRGRSSSSMQQQSRALPWPEDVQRRVLALGDERGIGAHQPVQDLVDGQFFAGTVLDE